MPAISTRSVTAAIFAVIAVLPYALMLFSGKNTYEPARGTRSLNIISPHNRELRQEYERGFNSWRTDHGLQAVTINWFDAGGSSKILKDIETRFTTSPDNPGIDIMFGGGVDPFMKAAKQGWLETVEFAPELTNGIPATVAGSPVMDPDRKWFGVAVSGFGIIYNAALIKRLNLPVPADWDDLGKPEYYSWISSGDPRSSGSVHTCYEIILQAFGFSKGWELITRISANVRNFGESAGSVPREVAAAEIAAGMVIDQYAQRVIRAVGDERLKFTLPTGTTSITPDSIAILKHAREPELAHAFLEYTLSVEGQRLLFQPAGTNGQMSTLCRMPVLALLYAEPGAPAPNPYTMAQGLKLSNATTSQRYAVLNDLMGTWLIDTHADLTLAWKAVIARGCREDEVRELCAPPVSEEQLLKLAAVWNDPRARKETMDQWVKDAQARYKRLSGTTRRTDQPL